MKRLLLNSAIAAARHGQSADVHVVRKICTMDENGNPLRTSVTKYATSNTGRLKHISFDFVSSPGIPAGAFLLRFNKNKIVAKQKLLLRRKVLPKDKFIISIKRKLLIKLLRSA